MLTREQILAQTQLRSETVPVPEWGDGETVIVRALSGADRDEYENGLWEMKDGKPVRDAKNMTAKLVALSVVDESGEKVFQSADVQALGQLDATPLNRIYAVAHRLSGLGGEALEQAGKNSVSVPSGDSS